MKKTLVLVITLLLSLSVLVSGVSAACNWEYRLVEWWYSCGGCSGGSLGPDAIANVFYYEQTSATGCEYPQGYTTEIYIEYYCSWVTACGN